MLASAFVFTGPSFAQAPGEPSAVVPGDCDRDCLIGFARRYMDALAHKDISRAPLAKHVRFTENDVVMPIGSGVWGSISSVASSAMEVADTLTGNAAWFGTIEEHGAPAYYAMRIVVRDRAITDVETVVERNTGMPAPFGDTAKVVHDPAFADVLPEDQQRPRERLIAVANGYFSTVELNDGEVLTQFDPECDRMENGVSTTSGSSGAASIAQGCEAQFKLGYYRINKRVRERRYPLVDTVRGVVVGTGFFDHANAFDSYSTTDGKVHKTFLKYPNSLSLMEAFKIRNGLIYRVEAIFTYVPYFMHSPWSDPVWHDAPPSGHAAESHAGLETARSPNTPSGAQACDRTCLIGFADRYMNALVAKNDRDLPWAKVVKFTENSVSLMIGDGLWGTISSKSSAPLLAADPATGNVAWVGLVEEHGSPAYYAMRLKVEGGKISEVETVVDRKGTITPFGDPATYALDPGFAAAAGPRMTRAALVALVDGYYSTLQRNDGKVATKLDSNCTRTENGAPTTQGTFGAAAAPAGCEAQFKLGLFKFDDQVRARRFSVVDEERGIVVATAYIDRAAHDDTYTTTDGQSRPTPAKYPNTLGLMETFKVRDGKIYRIESIVTVLPYLMNSAWVN